MAKLLEKTQNLSPEFPKKEAGLEAERRIAQSLKDAFKSQKVKVNSRLDNNSLLTGKNKDVDIVAVFPNGKQFAISCKKRNAQAVFLHPDGDLRLIRKRRTSRMSKPDPIQDLIDDEKWLRTHRKNIFARPGTGNSKDVLARPGSRIVLPSFRVLVFASPTAISKREHHQYVTIGEQEVLRIQRAQDFVFVLQEDRLCAFVQALAVPTR